MSNVAAASCLPVVVAATVLWSTAANAEIYHCVVDGVPKFSDKPCHAGDAPVSVPDVTVVPAQKSEPLARQHDARVQAYQKARAEEDAAWGDEYAARVADEARIRNARVRGEVVTGMSDDDVRKLLGDPQRVATRTNARGRIQSWSYNDSEHGRVTVTLQDDIVVDVRSSKTRSH
ncbi:hypothetical protein [Solimonas terrae]|uniref:DUF4124 domain-containing protein n=1 Tax=Solimonas terrae TaxID=1396819 RepID=A0A6M2BR28_9GAMM|nr:hypothetical protein [Solimonas terrae]NGY04661.1 hypothetical protein [Solimonas terrae]